MPRAAGMRTAGRLIQKAGQDRRRSKAEYVKIAKNFSFTSRLKISDHLSTVIVNKLVNLVDDF